MSTYLNLRHVNRSTEYCCVPNAVPTFINCIGILRDKRTVVNASLYHLI